MAIVRMKKLSAIGLDSVKEDLMEELMRLGVVELSAQEAKLSDEEWSSAVSKDGDEEAVAKYDALISEVSAALDVLSKYGTGKKPLFRSRKPVSCQEFNGVLEKRKEISGVVDVLLGQNRHLNDLKAEQNKMEAMRVSLLPWESYDLAFDTNETKYAQVLLGVVPASADPEQIRISLEEEVAESFLEVVGSDAEQSYLSVICLKEQHEVVSDFLRQSGFNHVHFQEPGTALDHVEACESRLVRIEEEKELVIKEIQEKESWKTELEYLYDQLVMERDQQKIRGKLLLTERTFYLDGWVPGLAAARVETLLKEKDCWYELREPEKEEETPVLLHNGSFSTPFEAITKLYALPDSRSIDATPFFSFFYAVFFGMMLSDAAYGVILAVACFIGMKKFRLEGMTHRMVKMLFYCGISTIVWGILFGGYFGDVVTVVSQTFFHKEVTIPPLWFNPVDNAMTLLAFSLILGVIHLFVGMGISGYLSIRDGRPFDAVCDVGLWYLIIAGLGIFMGSFLGALDSAIGQIGLYVAAVGAVGVILFGGRHKKGIGKIFGGVASLYNITSYLGDILSYSRLLALGLATGVIATVINTMGSLAGGGIVGVLLFVVVFAIGHAYNLAINSLGSFVHSSRLQYVEFFGKFYESGGEEFEPFGQNTKYVELIGEEEK